MEDFGVAKGYIELDISNMKSSVSSAQKELEKIERSGKLAQSEFDKLEAVSKGTGSAFEEAANRANILSRYISTAKDKTTVYKKEIDGLNTIIKRSGEEQAKLKTKIENTSSQYEKSKEKLNSLSDAYKAAQKEIKTVTDEYKAAQKEIKAVTDEYGKNSDEAKEVAEKHKEVADKYKEVTEKHKEIISSYEKAADATDKYRNELEQLKSEHNALDMEIDESKEAIIDFQTKVNETETSISNMAVQLAETKSTAAIFGQEMQDAGDKIQAAGDKINSIGSKLTVGVTTPLVGAGGAAVNFALQAGDSLAKVSTIADETVLSMDEISAGAMEVSNDTGVAFADFNEALYQTISATGDTANAIGYTEIAAKAAKGGFTDTATAVDGLTTIMNSYGLSGVENMQKVSDMMLMTQNYGKTTFGELASSMGQVIPITSQLNMSIEEVMSIMATLTKNGIGTSEAVTGLKAALSNIISPSTEAAKAAELLGLDFSASALQSKGMTGVMDDVKAALQQASPEFAELSEKVAVNKSRLAELEEQGEKSSEEYKNLKKETKGMEQSMETLAQAADSPIGGFATLFGSVEGLNSMMVLTSDTGAKDMQGAMDAMKGSAGATEEAFNKMNNSDLGKIKKELNKLKNTGIEVGNKLLPLVTQAVGFVGELAEKFSKLSPKEQEAILKAAGFAAALGPVLKVTGTTTTGIGKMTSGVGSLLESFGKSKAKADVLKNGMEAVEKGTLNANSSVGGFSGLLSKLGSPLGVAALATTAIVGVGTAFAIANEKAKKANLEEHFGTVKLSAEEVEDVAKRLTTNDWTVRLDAEIEAKQKLEEFESSIQTSIDDMNKAEWKISVGLELSEEERQNYISSVNNYVTSVQDYIEQQHYTANLAIDAVFEPGTTANDNFKQFSDEFYNGLYGDLQALGEKLAEQVNNAWEDNVMTDEEMNAISRTREEIQKELDKIAKAEYQLKLENIQASANTGTGLTAESFEAVQKQITKEIDTRKKEIEQAKVKVLIPLQMQLNDGNISLQEFSEAKQRVEQQANKEFGELTVDVVNVEIGSISGKYGEDIDNYLIQFSSAFDEKLSDFGKTYHNSIEWEQFWNNINGSIGAGIEGVSNGTKLAVSGFLKNMEPDIAQLESIAQTYTDAGKRVPQNVSEGLQSYYELEAMCGNTDHMWEMLAAQVANSPELQNTLIAADKGGQKIPDELTTAMKNNFGLVYDATEKVFEQVLNGASVGEAASVQAMSDAGFQIPQVFLEQLINAKPQVQQQATELLQQLILATETERPQIIQQLSDLGITGGDTLVQSMNSKQGETDAAVRALLQLIPSATAEEKEQILSDLHNLGIDLSQTQINALSEKQEELSGKAKDSAWQTVEGFRASIEQNKGSSTSAVGIWAQEIMDQFRNKLGINSPSREFASYANYSVEGYTNEINARKQDAINAVKKMASDLIEGLKSKNIPDASKKEGGDTALSLSSGMESYSNDIFNQGQSIAQSGIDGIESIDYDASFIWGQHLGEGLADGISSQWDYVANAASELADAAARYLHFTRPDEGPLRNYEQWPEHFIGRYAELMVAQKYKVRKSALQIMDEVNKAMNIEPVGKNLNYNDFIMPSDARNAIEIKSDVNTIDYDRLAKSIAKELRAVPIKPEISVEMKDGNIYDVNYERIGRKTAPTISRIITKRV